MTSAIARVEQRISITGADNASDAINKAKKSLQGLEKTTRKAGDSSKDFGKKFADAGDDVAGGSGKLATTLSSLGDFAGTSEGAFRSASEAAGAFDDVISLLPGPIGIAIGSIAALGTAAFLLNKHLDESAAKLDLLGGTGVNALKDSLNLSVDGAVKLSQALDDLKDKSLRPSSDLLKEVIKNAESLGKDGAEAASAFVTALQGGPEALKKFQAEFGRLRGVINSLPDLATALGLDAKALGLSKELTTGAKRQQQARTALLVIQKQQLELDILRRKSTDAYQRKLAEQPGFARTLAGIEQKSAADKAAAIELQIAAQKRLVSAIQAETIAAQRALVARQVIASNISLIDASAAAESDKKFRGLIREQGVITRIGAARKALQAFDVAHVGALTAALKLERNALAVNLLQAKAGANALASERRQERIAAAARGRAAASAVLDARQRIAKAKIDRDGIRTQKERITLLDLERAKAIDGVKGIKSYKARQTARIAIDEEYKTKKAKVERDIRKETEDEAKKAFATQKKLGDRRADAARAAIDSTLARERAGSVLLAANLRKHGQLEKADLAERRQAKADYAAELIRINEELKESNSKVAVNSAEAHAYETVAENKRVAAKRANAARLKEIDEAAKDRIIDHTQIAIDAFQSSATAVQAVAGALGNTAMVAISKGMAEAAQGVKALSVSLDKAETDSEKASAAIDGVATVTAGLATTAIDADTARTVKNLENEKQRKLAAATSEKERAEITDLYEAKKAKAVEDAEKRKAAILGAMEVAKGIAAAVSQNYIEAAGHAVSAGLFFGVAGGAFGGAPAASAPTTGFNDTTTGGGGGGGGGAGAGVTVINNFNQPLTTKQNIGTAVHGALRSLKSTGMADSKGV